MAISWAAVFPGQGSQATGMLADLGDDHAVVRDTFQEASDCLDTDLWSLAQHGPTEQLNQTQRTQPVMLAAGVATWRLLQQQTSARPHAVAGHSLGEYSALVAAGVLHLADAVHLVAERAHAMQAAVPERGGRRWRPYWGWTTLQYRGSVVSTRAARCWRRSTSMRRARS